MSSEDKIQFKVRIQRGITDRFRRNNGLLSYEMERLMLYYISMGGVLPLDAHTHISESQNSENIPTSLKIYLLLTVVK
jgi:hypothetical protein